MSDPQSSHSRHEWLPNRMFDTVNNPFAIQNLLKKEQDDTFLAKRDERPVVGYSDTELLKAVVSQPAVDFQLDQLLDQPLPEVPTFQVEADDKSSLSPVAPAFTDAAEEAQAFDAMSTEETILQTAIDLESDKTDSSQLAAEVINASDLSAETVHGSTENINTENIITETQADAKDAVQLAGLEDGLTDQVSLAQKPVLEQATDAVIDQDTDQTADQLMATSTTADSSEHDSTTETDPTTGATDLSAEPIATDAELAAIVSDSLTETSVADQAEPAMTAGLDNAEVTQLIEAAREEAQVDAHAAGFQEGLEAGLAQAKSEMQAEVDEKLAVIDQMIKGLQQLQRDPDALFEPMKKLAMHLAQQLVRGELTQSGQVISRLVENCLRELAASGEKAVIIHLNPEDLEQYKPLATQFGDSIVMRPDALLARGSVRASIDGSVVEDVIDRRVKGLSKSLAQPVASGWRPAMPASNSMPKSVGVSQPALVSKTSEAIKADNPDHDDEVTVHESVHDHDDHNDSNDDDSMIDAMIDASSLTGSDDIDTDRANETPS